MACCSDPSIISSTRRRHIPAKAKRQNPKRQTDEANAKPQQERKLRQAESPLLPEPIVWYNEMRKQACVSMQERRRYEEVKGEKQLG